MQRIFFSYRKDDCLAEAMALYGLLAQRLGKDKIFIDIVDIRPGEHWLAKLKRELVRSDTQLVLIGLGWLKAKDEDDRLRLGQPDDIVTLEIASALERKANIIPVLLQGAKMPKEDLLPPDLTGLALRQGINIEQVTNDEEIDNLINILTDLPERTPNVLGGCFHLEGHIGKTRHTDIYLAVPESEAHSLDTVAIHLLRQDSESEVRDWFERRCSLWQRVTHSNVVELNSKSDFQSSAQTPFFAVPTHTGGQMLGNEIKDSGGIAHKKKIDILNIASRICESAHRQGVLLQSLEPLHFWFDSDGQIRYEGFDAVVALGDNSAKQGKVFRKYCIAPERLAPETGTRKASYTVDIYALGMLLKAMELETGQSLETLRSDERYDRWNVFIFHCLAADPSARFQNLSQFRHFLGRCTLWHEPIPEFVALDGSSEIGSDDSGFSVIRSKKLIGRAPVTNIEYEYFCIETKYPLHCPDPNSRRVARRLQGPLCPVVNVNLNDAKEYCDWLSKKTSQEYRLPTEAEWMRAAVGCERGYSGGGPVANCSNRFGGPTVVGSFINSQSDIGCWDMLGNVWEWCSDRSNEGTGLRILKGGSYSCNRSRLSSVARQTAIRTHRASNVGFRVLKGG